MKLFKKFLSTIISVGMLFSVASLSVFATPTNLDECCAELDKILTPEEKENIKQSEHSFRTGYIGKLWRTPLGMMI